MKTYEFYAPSKGFREVSHFVTANNSEIICINDVLKAVSGGEDKGSSYVKGMKTWTNSFDSYFDKLVELQTLLQSNQNLSEDQLRSIKEVIINFPSNILEESRGSFEDKLVTANIMNTLSTVFNYSNTVREIMVKTNEKK
jgi:hypothetical protein